MHEQHFATPIPVRLEIKLASGEIEVNTVAGDESAVTLTGPSELVEATRVELDGDRLLVIEPRRSFLGLLRDSDGSLHVRALVPHGSGVTALTASSDTRLEGSFGDLDLRSASGDVRVSGDVAGDVSVKGASGDVHLPHIHGDLEAQTVSGDLRADAVDGSVAAKSVSGDVRIEALREGRVNVQNVSGDISLGVVPGTAVDLDAGSVSGDVSSDVPLSRTPESDEGPTVVIRTHSVSGDFRVFRAG
jgi:hypothetical protein